MICNAKRFGIEEELEFTRRCAKKEARIWFLEEINLNYFT